MRRVARIEQIALRGTPQRPVDVLARAVDAGKWLLVRQAGHAIFLGYPLERDHDQMLVIGSQVGRLEDRRDLVLARSHFVVAGLHRHAELAQVVLDLQHEGQHALGDRSEIMILEFLSLRRLGAKQRAAGRVQVGPCEIEVTIDQKVFLLRTGRRRDEGAVVMAEQLENAVRLLVQRLHRPQHRGLLIEGFTRPRHKGRGNAQRGPVGVLQNIGRAGHVPDRVAACLERGANATGREARSVWLALDQRLAAELGQRSAVTVEGEKAVVLFGC